MVLCGFYIFYTQDNRKEMKMIKNNIEIYWDEILNTATIWEEDTALPKRDVQKLLDMSYSRNQGTDKDIPRIDYLHMIKVNHYEIKNIEKLTTCTGSVWFRNFASSLAFSMPLPFPATPVIIWAEKTIPAAFSRFTA